MNYPQRIINFILDTVFPIICLGCNSFSAIHRRTYLCKRCLRLITTKKEFECIGCKKNSPLGKTCLECRDKFKYLDNLLIVANYKNPLLEKAIKVFKYRFVSDMAKPLSHLLKKYITWLAKSKGFNLAADNPMIIPIPLHPRRLNWRGFNQAEIIAQSLGNYTQQNIQTNILIRLGQSRTQANIKEKDQRLNNPKNKFNVINTSIIKNKTIILVDDICTTGATLNECARILKEAGAKKVIGFVIARG